MSVASELDQRYGRTRSTTRRKKWLIGGVAGGFALVLVAWLLWAGLFAPASSINVEDTGHVLVSDSLVTVKYQLTVEPGTASSCAVQALDKAFDVIGWRIIDVPASEQRVRSLETQVRSSQQAVTGLIYRCWPA